MTSRTNTGAANGVQNLTYGTKKNMGILFKNLFLINYNATNFRLLRNNSQIMYILICWYCKPQTFTWGPESDCVLKCYLYNDYSATITVQALLERVDSKLFKLLSKNKTGALRGVQFLTLKYFGKMLFSLNFHLLVFHCT